MKKVLLIFIGLLGVSFAQKSMLHGVVLHKETKAGIAEAKLALFEESKMVNSTMTDFEGNYSIPLKAGKEYLLKVSKISYEDQLITFVANKALFENLPFTIQLPSLKLDPDLTNLQKGMEQKIPNAQIAEDIGNLSNLPPGSKILDVKPMEINEKKQSKFNVNKKKSSNNSIDTELIKKTYNKSNIQEVMYKRDNSFPSSYVVENSIFYDVGKVLLTEKVKEFLDNIAVKALDNKKSKVQIYAYADGLKEAEVSEYLSKKRAEEITNYLVNNSLMKFKQLEVIIKGNTELSNGCYPKIECNEFQHQENRRVDLVFTR